MTPRVGAKVGKSAKAEPNWSSSRPPASAISEATSVSIIATTLRNTSVSTSIATATPMSSPTGAVLCSAWSTIGPLRETSSPARSPIDATSARRFPGSLPRFGAVWSYWTAT